MKIKQKINSILKISLSLLFSIFTIIILDKFKLGINILDIRFLFNLFLVGILAWLVCVTTNFFYKMKREDIYIQIRNTLKLVVFFFQGKQIAELINFFSSANLLVLFISGIVVYGFFSVFSENQVSDMTILFISVLFIAFNLIAGVEGKIFVVTGLVFLILCPFFVFKSNEFFADKSATWSFVFLIVGILSETLQRDNKNLIGLKNMFNYHLSKKPKVKNASSSKNS